MNKLIDSETDNKDIGLLKNLAVLRYALDVYCLISANVDALKEAGLSKNFFPFAQMSSVQLIALRICMLFEIQGNRYKLYSIDGVLKSIEEEKLSVSDRNAAIGDFVQKYGSGIPGDDLNALSSVISAFRKEHGRDIDRFKTVRDKLYAHSEFGFLSKDLPSYEIMEKLFNFGKDFYELVLRAFTSVVPHDLNRDRKVKTSLKKILKKLGCEKIKTNLE